MSSIVKADGRAIGAQVDVADRGSVGRMAARVERALGPVDVLVNNAGWLGALGPIWEVDPDEWWRKWEVNVRGVMLCGPRSVAEHGEPPSWPDHQSVEWVVGPSSASPLGSNASWDRSTCSQQRRLGSVMGPIGAFSAYPVSKTAVTRLTERLALDCHEYGISVFAMRPGLDETTRAVARPLAYLPPGRVGHCGRAGLCVRGVNRVNCLGCPYLKRDPNIEARCRPGTERT